jgi:hypothetical protein
MPYFFCGFIFLNLQFNKSNMAIILNLETATKNCSVALAKEGNTIACKEIAEQNFSHAEKLHFFIEELLAENNLQSILVPSAYHGRNTHSIKERNEARQELAKLKEGLSKVLLKWPASSCPECGEGYSATLLSEEIERLLR